MLASRTFIELVFRDASGSTGAVTVHIPNATTYADAASGATALGAALASVSGCVLVRQRIIYRRVIDGSPSAAEGSTVKRRAVFYYDTEGGNPFALVEIPSPLDSIFLTSGVTAGYEVNRDNIDVIAFNDGLVANNATNPFGDAIVDFAVGYLQSRV